MKHTVICVAAVALAAGAWAPRAGALDVMRNYVSHGAANCQSALPVFDGQIRKRPKAVANEGTGNAFVTCDFENLPNGLETVDQVVVGFINRAPAVAQVSCTLVQGLGDEDMGAYIPKTVDVQPGVITGVRWSPDEDNGDVAFTAPAVSCNLRPGMEIIVTQMVYQEYVGD